VTRFSLFAAAVVVFAGCSRPVAPGHVRLKLEKQQCVSLGLFDGEGHLVAQPFTGATLAAGTHEIDCRAAPAGDWTWRAVGFDPVLSGPEMLPTAPTPADQPRRESTKRTRPKPLAIVGAGMLDARGIAGGDAGAPCAVTTDERSVFLGWQAARVGHEIVACDPEGRVLWGHHHGGAQISGVRALAADGGTVFVLADAEGSKIYRLDANTGTPQPWKGRLEREITIKSLWGSDPKDKPTHAEYLAADHGRLYVTFADEQFVAVLDAQTGNYVTTLTGPEPGPMAFSTTPMRDPETNEEKIIDFGVAAIAKHGLAYFLMEHEPPWVMMSTTRWLQEDETIAAVALIGDAMKTNQLTIVTGLGAPYQQVQLRPAEAAEGFSTAVGEVGGRPEAGPWKADGLRDIRAIAVDAAGQLWVAEGDLHFGRFTTWKPEGKQGTLLREVFGPADTTTLAVDPANPFSITLGGLRWQIDPATFAATPTERLADSPTPTATTNEYRDSGGLLLWQPPETETRVWSIHRTADGRLFAWRRGVGAELHRLAGLEKPIALGNGKVTVGPK